MRSSHFSCVFGQLFQPRGELPLEELSLHRIKNNYMYFALLAIALEVLIKTCGAATLTVSPAHTAEPLRSVSPHFISFALGENIRCNIYITSHSIDTQSTPTVLCGSSVFSGFGQSLCKAAIG